MKGDVLIINDYHRKAARQVLGIIFPQIEAHGGRFFLSVAGESGAGKSEIAASIAEALEAAGYKSYVFGQDDYFVYPPKTNAARREEDISRVGMDEVRLDLLDSGIAALRRGESLIRKPLVIFNEDRITSEEVDLGKYEVFIAEGTYTTALENIDCRIFIDRDLNDTRADRKKRAREKQDEYLEQILSIEHRIISAHKKDADIIISKDYQAYRKEDYDK